MNYKFSDYPKLKNYIGFDSGVICFYPNYNSLDLLEENNDRCTNKDFFKQNFFLEG